MKSLKQIQIENMKKAMQIRDELFDLANAFAGEETGGVAVELHRACNAILTARNLLKNKGIKVE